MGNDNDNNNSTYNVEIFKTQSGGGGLIQSGTLQHTQISLACFRENGVLQSWNANLDLFSPLIQQ